MAEVTSAQNQTQLEPSVGTFEEKLDLADRIDDLSTTTLNDRERVEPILDEYTAAVEADALDADTAEAGVERLRHGEFLTETVLAATGPADLEWWADTPNLAAATAAPTLQTTINLILIKSALARKIKDKLDRLTGIVDYAIDRLESALSRFTTVMAGASAAAEHAGRTDTAEVADDIYEAVDEGLLTTVQEIEDEIENALDPVIDAVATALRGYVEQGMLIYGTNAGVVRGLDGSLSYLHDELDADAAIAGFNGDLDSVRRAYNDGRGSITQTAGGVADALERFDSLVAGLGTLETFVDLMEDASPEGRTETAIRHLQTVVSLLQEFMAIFLDALSTGAGIKAFELIAYDHHDTVERIVHDDTNGASADGDHEDDTESEESGQNIIWDAGGTGGTYYPLSDEFKTIVENNTPHILQVRSTGGSVENVGNLGAEEADFALIQSDVAYFAYNGTGLEEFEGKPVKSLRGVATLYPETIHIITRPDANIESLQDMEGATVNTGYLGHGSQINALQILESVGLSQDNFEEQNTGFSQAAHQLRHGDIDAAFIIGGWPNGAVEEFATTTEIDILDLGQEERTAILESAKWFAEDTIPGGTYEGVEEDVDTVSVQTMIATHEGVDEGLVQDITAAIFDNTDQLDTERITWRTVSDYISLDTALEGMSIDLHPGAQAYFDE